MLVVRYKNMKNVNEKEILEKEQELREEWEVYKSKILHNKSDEEKEKINHMLNQSYENDTLYSFRKNYSGRIEALRIYKIDLIRGQSLLREIPEGDISDNCINGAWNRFTLTGENGYYLTYYPEFKTAMLNKLSRAGINYYYTVLYMGIIMPNQFDKFPSTCKIEKGQTDGQDSVAYIFLDITQPGNKLVIYTDPSVGYRYFKMVWVSEGKIYRTLCVRNYKSFNAISFPTYHEEVWFNDAGVIQQKETFEIKEASFNQPFDPNTFTVDFTPQTRIIVDEDTEHIKSL